MNDMEALNGCRWCGREKREHAIEWHESAGYHTYKSPTNTQRVARMTQRRRQR